jgi:hypothetical protein
MEDGEDEDEGEAEGGLDDFDDDFDEEEEEEEEEEADVAAVLPAILFEPINEGTISKIVKSSKSFSSSVSSESFLFRAFMGRGFVVSACGTVTDDVND